jgi:SNF2 family DNA or RNA helicase
MYYISPLLRTRFLRVVVDEGHVMSSTNSERSDLASKIPSEHRWIVSGTPAASLDKLQGLLTFLRMPVYGDRKGWGVLIESDPALARAMQRWKMGKGIGIDRDIEPGSSVLDRLGSIMERIVVRNRAEDVERDIVLPPCTIKGWFSTH